MDLLELNLLRWELPSNWSINRFENDTIGSSKNNFIHVRVLMLFVSWWNSSLKFGFLLLWKKKKRNRKLWIASWLMNVYKIVLYFVCRVCFFYFGLTRSFLYITRYDSACSVHINNYHGIAQVNESIYSRFA